MERRIDINMEKLNFHVPPELLRAGIELYDDVKKNAIEAATEAACLILSVDETVRNPSSEKPDARNYGKGGGKGGPRMGGRGRGRGNALQRM